MNTLELRSREANLINGIAATRLALDRKGQANRRRPHDSWHWRSPPHDPHEIRLALPVSVSRISAASLVTRVIDMPTPSR